MAEIAKIVPRLKFNVRPRHRNLKCPEEVPRIHDGPLNRINKLRKTVTALFKYERIEVFKPRCEEARGYAERVLNIIVLKKYINKHF